MTTFYIIKDLDTGDYMPNPLGRGGRGGTHQELVPAGSGVPPRLYTSSCRDAQALLKPATLILSKAASVTRAGTLKMSLSAG